MTMMNNYDLPSYLVYYKYIPAHFVNQMLHSLFYKQIENRQ